MPHRWTLAVLFALAAQGALAAPPPGPLSDTRLMQVTLPTRDLDRAVAFYTDVLGVKLLMRGGKAAMLDAGGFRIRLEANPTAPKTDGVEIYFDDPGLSRFKPLQARGVKFVGPPETVFRSAAGDVQLAEFYDPDGNAIGIMGAAPKGQ